MAPLPREQAAERQCRRRIAASRRQDGVTALQQKFQLDSFVMLSFSISL
jgi:hypothetical protein